MAEHEAEMQRQMMSVPAPGTQMMNAPPPGMPVPNLNQNQQIMQPNNMMPPPTSAGMPMMHSSNDINQPPPPPPGFNPTNEPPPNWGTDETDKSAHNLPPLMSVKVDKPDEMKGSNAQNTGEVVLPKALLDVFALKTNWPMRWAALTVKFHLRQIKHRRGH